MASLIAGAGAILLVSLLLIPSLVAGEEEDANDTLETRHGVLYVLERRPDDADSFWELKLKGRVLARSDEKLQFWRCYEQPCPRTLLTGDDGREYVLVAKASGGIACPYHFVLVELQEAGKARVSQEFGSCNDLFRTRLDGDTLSIEMPAYVPHPDFLTPAERRLRERTTEVYTYRNGTVTMKKRVGR